jgi:hypothetical protein
MFILGLMVPSMEDTMGRFPYERNYEKNFRDNSNIRVFLKVTLSSGLLSPRVPSFSEGPQRNESLLNLGMKS